MSEDLAAIREAALALLARGAADRRAPAHTPSLATVGLDGRPRLRTVVLRSVEPGPVLRIHTDRRSAKVAEIAADPRVALHVYDAGEAVQLRIDAVATLHRGDAVADAAWVASRPMSRICYGMEPGPGAPLPAGGAFTLPGDPDAVEAGRSAFVVILCRVTALEWLHLAASGHRRARFTVGGEENGGRWLAP